MPTDYERKVVKESAWGWREWEVEVRACAGCRRGRWYVELGVELNENG